MDNEGTMVLVLSFKRMNKQQQQWKSRSMIQLQPQRSLLWLVALLAVAYNDVLSTSSSVQAFHCALSSTRYSLSSSSSSFGESLRRRTADFLLRAVEQESIDTSSRSDEESKSDTFDWKDEGITSRFTSPVLQQVFPAMVEHTKEFGHPNIPLGTSEGRQVYTLRRLHTQQKLATVEVDVLTDMGFLWHSLEDVYELSAAVGDGESDGTPTFDDFYHRLLNYYEQHGNFECPKKYPADPELGAWVTGIRRLGRNGIRPEHKQLLDQLATPPGFVWTSKRQCGSAFMKQFRDLQRRVNEEKEEAVWSDETVQKWVKAQQLAAARGDMSDTRQHYMEQLLGDKWKEWNNNKP